MIFICLSYDFVLVILYICSIDVTLMSFSIYSISVDLFDCYQLFFSPFSSCYYVTLKRVYETSNLSENNLIFNIIRLTFLASESLELIKKTLHLKDISFHQLLIPTKRYLWKQFFQDPYGPHHFLEKCWHQQFFRAVFVNFRVWENFPQERKFFNWVDLYVSNKGLNLLRVICNALKIAHVINVSFHFNNLYVSSPFFIGMSKKLFPSINTLKSFVWTFGT